jgi:spore germination protein KA
MALTVPFVFVEGFQNPDDYYALPFFASFTRGIRLLGYLISIYLPGIYVALGSYHQGLFPTPLLISVAAAREGLPFPIGLEALLMLILFEILREAGLRMPRSLGQAVSIVGALVIGQAAASAGLVGAPMVVVVAATAITSFLAVPFADQGALFRFILTIMASMFGFFGMVLISIEVLSSMVALRSLGVPYLSPITPLNFQGLKDTIFRAPLWAMDNRPAFLNSPDTRQQLPDQMPKPPQNKPNQGDNQ